MAVERVEGVREATFSFDRSQGYVLFDTTATTVTEIIAELERLTAFSAAEVREAESQR